QTVVLLHKLVLDRIRKEIRELTDLLGQALTPDVGSQISHVQKNKKPIEVSRSEFEVDSFLLSDFLTFCGKHNSVSKLSFKLLSPDSIICFSPKIATVCECYVRLWLVLAKNLRNYLARITAKIFRVFHSFCNDACYLISGKSIPKY